MAIRVVTVPNPAAGHDWTFTVPAQWVARLLGVTATLTTSLIATVALDASGNGHDATYWQDGKITWGAAGPFGGAPNRSVARASGATDPNACIGYCTPSTAFNFTSFTIGAWVNVAAAASSFRAIFANTFNNASGQDQGYVSRLNANVGQIQQLRWLNNTSVTSVAGIAKAAWHHLAVTSDGANARFYIDGVLDSAPAAAVAIAAVTETPMLGGFPFGGQDWVGNMAGLFVNAAVLGAARLATYVADSAVGSANYKADVLADTPVALWMLDDVAAVGARPVALAVTDGTTTLASIPGVYADAAATSQTWSWQTLGPSAAANGAGSVNVVNIPEMDLPGGYTVGTVTPGMLSTDQWSGITVWFDDGTGTAGGPGGVIGGAEYLNALLVPDYSHRSPT